ncbi:hypothetical protein OC846_005044 [Tilletia horrida]|uniref:Uncharacterized protein n=1 Tax=Tilletia horrida TaxID=155126 RepID=A0AAN6GPA9_9BASI|nr:hypothetical protein OC846_005044 [Tilletia horrida]KAK0562565.1 hypothetical protein OC861_005254 [Tilletia horrida]
MTSMLNGFKTAVSSETDLLQAKQLKIIQEMEEQARELAAKAKVVRMWQKRLEEAALEAKETADRWQLSSRELSRTAGEQAIAILKPVDAEEMLREAAAVEKRKAISADDRSDVSASSSTMRRSAATRLLKISNVLKALTG